ncbi:MAG: hypothetical protein PHU82_00310 [Candidatus Pacebacteria bacterium]|jgi:hypothetical protein|nr:hypothetical protein [Candidatus Paceibacterota bacterium]MDD4994419.1 hypothetical protein [Candidatus Paceibacterota bacterium]MDD5535173.1 hypothetical protein [Candidatus Paceibacterota bacterium]
MNILTKIFTQPTERKAFFYRISLFPETLEKLQKIKETLEDQTNHNDNRKQEAEIFRKVIGIAYHDMMQSVQNSKKTKKYIKFITTKNKGKKKKVVKEYYLKRAIV